MTDSQALREQIANGEILGTQAPGTANDLSVALLSLQQMKVTFNAAIKTGKQAISQSMGILNPEAVLEVTASQLPLATERRRAACTAAHSSACSKPGS